MVKEGSTVIIGGLRKEDSTEDTQQTPFFGSIPFLGKLFKTYSKTKTRTELLIILTPKLITGDTFIANADGGTFGEPKVKSEKSYPGVKKPKIDPNALPSEVFVPMENSVLTLKGPRASDLR